MTSLFVILVVFQIPQIAFKLLDARATLLFAQTALELLQPQRGGFLGDLMADASFRTFVAQILNCVARAEFTRYPTAMMASRL